MDITKLLAETLHGPATTAASTEREPFGDRTPVAASLSDTRAVVSYVVRDDTADPLDFWRHRTGFGTYFDHDNAQISPDAPRDADIAFAVERTETPDGKPVFTALLRPSSGFGPSPFGVYYPPAWQQDAFAARGTPVEDLLAAANDAMADFSAFAAGPVFAVVQETWERGADGQPRRTDAQTTIAFADYDTAWLMIEDDAETRAELRLTDQA